MLAECIVTAPSSADGCAVGVSVHRIWLVHPILCALWRLKEMIWWKVSSLFVHTNQTKKNDWWAFALSNSPIIEERKYWREIYYIVHMNYYKTEAKQTARQLNTLKAKHFRCSTKKYCSVKGWGKGNNTTEWADPTSRRKGERPGIRHCIHYHLTDLYIAPCESNGKGHAYWPKPSKKGAFHCLSLFSLLHYQSGSYSVQFLSSDNVLVKSHCCEKTKKTIRAHLLMLLLMRCIQNSIQMGLNKE